MRPKPRWQWEQTLRGRGVTLRKLLCLCRCDSNWCRGTAPGKHPADNDEDYPGSEKAHVIGELVWTRVHVVNTQNLMIDQTFDQIEPPPSAENPGPENA